MSARKGKNPGECQKGGIRESAEKGQNSSEYRKSRNPGKCWKMEKSRWASIGKVESERVPEMWNPGKYRKCGIWTGTENVEYGHVLERFESGLVPKRWNPGKCRKGGIWVSTGEGSE